ncbi:MAG: tetratricopeptide repeat protein [Rhizobacter sp.]
MNRETEAGRASSRSATLIDFPAVARRRHNLPATTTRVVGRAAAIDQVLQDVGRHRLVSIVGAGGIGKTTVAIAAAERATAAFPDGVWLVDFAPLGDVSLVPHAIAGATGLTVHSADILPALCRFLRERRLLLVLDNCEHLVAAIGDCVHQLLDDAPDLRIVATSRTRLGVAGEREHRLAGLAVPSDSNGLGAEAARAYPAIELFVDRATDRLDTFVLDDVNAPVVADICRRLDGIALAIELAAMRVDVFGVKALRQQLDDRFRLLSGARAGLERHRTLAATLDWSYGLLPDNEAGLLRAVSVFTGAFTLEGAAAVGGTLPGEAGGLLAGLVSKSLLSSETDAVAPTWRLLETTRAYGLERLARAGEDRAVRHRHAHHVGEVLERAAADWGRQLSRDWGAAHGAHLGDLRAALAWAEAEPYEHVLLIRLTTAGILLWNHFSLTDESRAHVTNAIARLGDAGWAGTAVEMNLQFALAGAILYTRGVTPDARLAIAHALRLSEQLADTDFRLRCLRLIGTIELFFGHHDAGIRTLETFLSIATAEDPTALAEGETHLAVGETFVGRLKRARRRMERLHAKQARDFENARFARFQYSNSVNNLVVLCHAQWLTGHPDAAARTAERILECGRQSAHELSLSIALAWNSLAYLWLGREDECSRHATMLEEIVERHGIVTWRPLATFCRGAVAAARQPGHPEPIAGLTRAIAEFRAIGHLARLPWYVAVLAEALGRSGRFEEAEARAREALALAAVQNERWCVPEILRIQARLASDQGRPEDAEPLLRQAIQVSRDMGAMSWRLRATHDLALLWQARSRTAQARRLLKGVHDRFSEGFETRDLLAATRLLAELRP